MNKLWDDLKDNMKEWGASAVEKAEEISRVAVAKGEEFTKISKLKYDISQVQKDKAKIYEKLGRLVFEKTKNNNMANFTANKEFFCLV
jgi:chaperonin cofactor prefoldin